MKKTANAGSPTHYVWEGSQVIAEYDGSTGALLREYINAGSRMLARDEGGVLSYFHQDRLSTRMMTDGSGNVTTMMDHLPFGEDAGTGAGAGEKHRFTTYERDAESNTDYAMNRQYEMAIGRFMQPDIAGGSIADPQSLNRYAYSLNDPVNVADPSGLFPTVPDQFNAAYSGPGVYWDGIRLMITEYEMVYRFWQSGAVDIFPDQAVRNKRGDGWIIRTGEDSSIDLSEFNDLWRFLSVGFQVDYQTIINTAVWRAGEALSLSQDCRELLANPPTFSAPDLRDYLGKISAAGKIHPGNVSGAGAATVPGKPYPEIKVTQGFFSNLAVTLGEGTLFPYLTNYIETRQTLIILHELGHATGAPTHGSKNPDSEARYNQLIYDKCIKGREKRLGLKPVK